MESAVINYLLRFDYPVLESKLKKEQSITDNELENLINSKLLLRYTFKDNSKDIVFVSLSDWSNNTFPMNKSGIGNPSSKENNKEINRGLTTKPSIPTHQFQKKVFKAPVLKKNSVSSKSSLKYSPVICKNLVEQLGIPPDFFPSGMAQEYGNYHFSSESVRKLLPILPPFTFPLFSSFTLKDFSSPLSIKKEISNTSFNKPECNVYKNAQAFNEQPSSLATSSEISNTQSSSFSTNNSDSTEDTSNSSNSSSSRSSLSSSSSSLPDSNSPHQNVIIAKRRFVRPLHPPLTSVMTPHSKPDISLNKREIQKENQQHSFFFISLKRVIDKANKMIADEEKERKEKEEREQRARNDPESLKAFESKLKELDYLSEKWKQIVIQLSQKLYPSAKELYHQQVFLRSCNQEGEKRKEEEKGIEDSSQDFMENSKHKGKESEVEESEDGEEIVKEKISEKDNDNNYFYSSVNNMPESLTMTMFLKQFGIEPDLVGYNETTDTFI